MCFHSNKIKVQKLNVSKLERQLQIHIFLSNKDYYEYIMYILQFNRNVTAIIYNPIRSLTERAEKMRLVVIKSLLHS
jgi:hypothetical protein